MTVMDEVERRRFLDTLRQDSEFRAEVRREMLTQELLALPQTVALLSASISGLTEHHGEMQRELTETRGDVAALVGTTGQLLQVTQNGFTEMRQGFNSIDARFTAIEAHFDQIEAEIRDLKNPPTAEG